MNSANNNDVFSDKDDKGLVSMWLDKTFIAPSKSAINIEDLNSIIDKSESDKEYR